MKTTLNLADAKQWEVKNGSEDAHIKETLGNTDYRQFTLYYNDKEVGTVFWCSREYYQSLKKTGATSHLRDGFSLTKFPIPKGGENICYDSIILRTLAECVTYIEEHVKQSTRGYLEEAVKIVESRYL